MVFSENNKEIKFSKSVDMLNEYINIDLNEKKIISKLYNLLKIKSLEDYDRYSRLSETITEYVQELLFDEEFDLIQGNNIDPIDIFKGVVVGIEDSNNSIPEKFLEYIRVLEKFMDTEVFIFVNLKEFFNNEEIIQIYNKLLLNKTKFIIVQSRTIDNIDSREVLYIIDEDFCEI